MSFRFVQPRSRVHIEKSEESQRVLSVLSDYLDGNIEEPMRFLVRFWKDQVAAVTYAELRSIIEDEDVPEQIMDDWFHDYSTLISEKMTPVWEESMKAGYLSTPLAQRLGGTLNTAEKEVREWFTTRSAELVTNCCREQKNAIRYLVSESTMSHHMSPAETARYIRPTIGLTKPQAAANLKHYNTVKEQLAKDHPRMKPESIEQKARHSAARYAEKQHRYRAEMIAQTEVAQAFNQGNDTFVRNAVGRGLMPKMKKEWITANTNACAICKSLEGKSVGMDDNFSAEHGKKVIRAVTVSIPPAHPKCRCAVKYIESREKSGIIKSDKQFGKKVGKHALDYGLDPSKAEDRKKIEELIDDIFNSPDEKRIGNWRGYDGEIDFSIKNGDVVVSKDGKFITLLKGGISNARVENARKR